MNKYLFFASLFLIPAFTFSQNWKEIDSIGTEHYNNGELQAAQKYFEKGIKLAEKEFGKNDTNYSKAAFNLAEVCRELGNYEKAESLYFISHKINLKLLGNRNPTAINLLNSLAVLYKRTGKYETADSLLTIVLNFKKEVFGTENDSYATTLNNMASLYHTVDQFDKAETMYKEALRIRKAVLGENHPDYAGTLNDLATLYDDLGQFAKAESMYKEVMRIDKETVGEKHQYYASDMNNLGALYFKMGQYEKSEPLYLESMKLNREIFGEKHPEYAISLNNLGELYRVMKKYNETEKLNAEALKIRKEVYGVKHPLYARSLNNMAEYYSETGLTDKAEQLYKEVLSIDKEIFGEKHSAYGMDLNNLASLYRKMGRYSDAENLYLEEIKIFKESLGEKHPYYAISLNNIAVLYSSMNLNDKAEPYFFEMTDKFSEQIKMYYPYLSEYEKTKFLNTFGNDIDGFYSFGMKRSPENESIVKNIFDFRINTKGLIANSVSNIRKRIIEGNDPELTDKMNRLFKIKAEIGRALTLSVEEQKNKNINLAELESSANELEKDISIKSEEFRSEIESASIDFKNIRNILAEKEAGIEFLEFKYYDRRWTDTVFYCAMIARSDLENPVLVRLCTLEELNEFASVSASSNMNYVKNADESNKLYELIWKPLESYLKGIEKVYISPSGVLNKISFACLMKDENNYLSDIYQIRYTGNLKDIAFNKDSKSTDKELTASVFGGLKYDIDSAEMTANSMKFKNTLPANNNSDDVGLSREETERSGWGYLEGTLTEANKISDLLNNSGYHVSKYLDEEGSEEMFKSVCSKNSPSILHISTHGFFYPEPVKKFQNNEQNGARYVYKYSSNPLMRSGLILAGANRVWKGQNEIEGVENGVLTAYEVANMDLSNTDLVVLSACETGLGDIIGGEGVYGLQRAFKVAGAKSLIMSLWKIPDKETVELMELFYTKWLINGIPKSNAFIEAQREMRKKYPPYYWAAFVMVE